MNASRHLTSPNIAFLTVCASLLVAGCGGPRTVAEGLEDGLQTASAGLGRRIASEVPAGKIVFVHMELSPKIAGSQEEGLAAGLGKERELVILGPGAMPEDLLMQPDANLVAEALKAHPDAAAIVCAAPIRDERLQYVPAKSPPIYALGWKSREQCSRFLADPRSHGGVFMTRDATGFHFEDVTARSAR